MKRGGPKDVVAGERRVALVPEVVPALVRAGNTVTVEKDAGLSAGFTDDAYRSAGAVIADSADGAYAAADMILKVQRPSAAEIAKIPEGAVLIGLLQPTGDRGLFEDLAARGVIACSMELVPRT